MAAQLKTKYTEKQKAKAMAMLEASVSITSVSQQLKIPKSTIHMWKEQYKKDKAFVKGEAEKTELQKTQEFIDKVEVFKSEFVSSAQNVVQLATEIAERRLKKALDAEKEIEKLIEMVSKDEELSNVQRKEIIVQLKQIKVEDISKLSIVAGTFYDKQALANKEATSIIDGNITVKKFEDY